MSLDSAWREEDSGSIKSLKKRWNEGTKMRVVVNETRRKKEEDHREKKKKKKKEDCIRFNTKLKIEMNVFVYLWMNYNGKVVPILYKLKVSKMGKK